MADERRRRERILRADLQQMLLLVPRFPDADLPPLMEDLAIIEAKLMDMEMHAARGHQIRAKAKWEQDGDCPSSFFFQKIQARKRKISIEGLYDEQKILRSSPVDLQRVVTDAFKTVFRSKGPPPGWQLKWSKVLAKLRPEVSGLQRKMLDCPISTDELADALAAMPGGKSPGHDGLTKEFFVLFWPELKELVEAAVQDGG